MCFYIVIPYIKNHQTLYIFRTLTVVILSTWHRQNLSITNQRYRFPLYYRIYSKGIMLNDHKTAYVLAAILTCVVCIILACCCRIISGRECIWTIIKYTGPGQVSLTKSGWLGDGQSGLLVSHSTDSTNLYTYLCRGPRDARACYIFVFHIFRQSYSSALRYRIE